MFKFTNFRCPIDLYNRLKAEAEKQDRTVTWVLVDIIKKHFGVK